MSITGCLIGSRQAGGLADDLTAVLDRYPSPVWPSGTRGLLHEYAAVLINSVDLARWADSDLVLHQPGWPGAEVRALDQRLAAVIANGSLERDDHMRALSVIGGVWRPILHEPAEEITENLDEILNAAMISFAPLE